MSNTGEVIAAQMRIRELESSLGKVEARNKELEAENELLKLKIGACRDKRAALAKKFKENK